MKRKPLRTVHLLATIGILAGCATTQPTTELTLPTGAPVSEVTKVASLERDFSGFLGDYSGLEPDPRDKSLLWYEVEQFNWLDYRAVQIDPLVVYQSAKAGSPQLDSEQTKILATYFLEAVEQRLGGEHPIVEEAAPGVLRIRAALTDVEPAKPAVNVLTALVLPLRFDLGSASIEVEFLDSQTGQRLATMVDRRKGSRTRAWQGFKKWGDARAAFRQWANELAVALVTNPEPIA